jgi:hypothetical protein
MTEIDAQPPAPDPALRRLEPLVGDWSMTGNLVGSSEENIVGRASFRWLEGGVLLQQDIEIDFAGQFQVKSHELIGYDPETGAFASHVYSNLSPTPLPYAWELRDNKLRNSLPTAHWMRRSRERSQTTAPPSRAAGGRIPAPTRPSTSPMTPAVLACREAPALGDAHTGLERVARGVVVGQRPAPGDLEATRRTLADIARRAPGAAHPTGCLSNRQCDVRNVQDPWPTGAHAEAMVTNAPSGPSGQERVIRIGIGLPAAVPGVDATTIGAWAAEAERAGVRLRRGHRPTGL